VYQEERMATMPEEIRSLVERLSPDLQQQVLKFAKGLARTHKDIAALPKTPLPPGTPGPTLLRFKLPSEDVEAMERALEDCERIEPDEY
jgi:hypothetical protein